MERRPVALDAAHYPPCVARFLDRAPLFDASCSPNARVTYIDADGGYFLKEAAVGTLKREATVTEYFHSLGLAAEVMAYTQADKDYLLTRKVSGEDCTADKYMANPKRLAGQLGEQLRALHSLDGMDFAHQTGFEESRAQAYLRTVHENYPAGIADLTYLPANAPIQSAVEAFRFVQQKGHLLEETTLIHGDYCLPNVIWKDWELSGYVDVDSAGVADRHIDLFWAIWSLQYNLGTDAYKDRFLDAYGRDMVDEERLLLIAACEVFG